MLEKSMRRGKEGVRRKPEVLMGKFRELKVWQRAKNFAVFIYKITNEGPFSKDFGLKDQIRRAAVSIASNIAEGDEQDTNRQSIRCFYIAKGSSAEVLTQATIAHDISYLSSEVYDQIAEECEAISSMLMRLIQSRSPKPQTLNPKP